MNKVSDRPPIVFFLLTSIGLIAAALCLAALLPTPEQASDGASAFDRRNPVQEAKNAGGTDGIATGAVR